MKIKGYMSIEAALVFPVVLIVVMLMTGFSIYVYDRIIVKECIDESLIIGANEEQDNPEEKMKSYLETKIKERGISLEIEKIAAKEEIASVKIRVDAKVNLLWITSTDLPIHVEAKLVKLDVIKLKRLAKIGKEVL